MKRMLLASAALLAMAMPGMAQAQEYTFALVPKALNNPFFDLARDGCMAAQEESDGAITCEYVGPSAHTEMEQIQIVQDLISRGVDGIAVAPSNAPAMGRALRAAQQAGIPTITWDSDLLPEDAQYRSTYIGTKNYDIGVNLAKLAQKAKPEGGTICLQSGGAAAANHNERMQGLRDTLSGTQSETPPGERLAGEGGWTEVDGCPLFTDDDSAKGVQQLSDILNRYGDLDVFVVTGAFTLIADNAFRQALAGVKDKIDAGELVMLAADTLPMEMQQVRDGLVAGLVGQKPYDMGHQSMFLLKDLAEGKEVQDPIFTGLDVCEQSNIDTCVKQGGS
ncbi:sugar-binding protein [Marinivivus vitaminiproducens]|uniref:sugar-binding protein n=1 Tax=Marinivivus vitaminiproducens TaxID=3035935 RepID=UPI00279CF9E2|nr:sugar-binding protein [Geminicoccaceae bacterium SCSIO 64248]